MTAAAPAVGAEPAPNADRRCVELLGWALPQLGLRWEGFRNVRGQVCKRLQRRARQLELADLAAYRARLEVDPAEWKVLEAACSVTISRVYRDRGVWDALRERVLPELADAALAAGERELRCWCVGAASGEEPYTLALVWNVALAERYPSLPIRILATDVNDTVLERARAAEYSPATLRDLPAELRERGFERQGGMYRLRDAFRTPVELRQQDVRSALPDDVFRLIMCRNVVFTYFDEPSQRAALERFSSRLAEGGALVVGQHEQVPPAASFEPWSRAIFRHRAAPGQPR